MKIVPKNREPKITFYELRVEAWEAHAAELGTSPEIVAELRARTEAAREAYLAQRAAQRRAEAATIAFHEAVAAMGTLGAAVLKQIRATAQSSGDASVYSTALIPPPAAGAPIGPPGRPGPFAVELMAIGRLKLTWACRNPPGSQGTMYQVSRRLGDGGAGGAWVLLGVTGRRRLIDSSIPLGTGVVTYEVRAVRSTAVGPPATFDISFGTDGKLPEGFIPARRDATTIAA